MRVRATAIAEGAGGRGSALRPLVWLLAFLVVVVGCVVLLSQLRETVVMTSADVRMAQARQSIANANHRTAELDRQTKAERDQAAAEAPWQPWIVGAQRFAMVALLAAVPLALLGALVAAGLLLRRHVSLPTVDGRVPLVGLDRAMSKEALARYQRLQELRRSVPTYEALPVGREGGHASVRRLEVLDGVGEEERPEP
jgi:hypothetical protein